MLTLDFTFEAELWKWSGGNWHFLTLPKGVSDDIKAFASEAKRGFGSVRVEARIGETAWRTSVFPSKDHGAFLLPVKKAVRTTEGFGVGDRVGVRLELDPEF